MKRKTLLMLLIQCIGIMLMSTTVYGAQVVTVDVVKHEIYANGNAIILAAGTTANYTVVYHDLNGNGIINDEDVIQTIDGATGSADTSGYDLSGHFIFGGKNNEDMTGNTKITITGGKFNAIYGGGIGIGNNVTGNTDITIR